MSNLQTFSVK